MAKFAFIIHPLTARDFARKFPVARRWPDGLVEGVMKYIPPLTVSRITGVASAHGRCEGWFVACPLSSRQMTALPETYVLNKIIKTGRLAEKLGAGIVGLGAFTSVVGDAGVTVARHLKIAVTTGNSYTVATALEGTRRAAALMGKELSQSHVLVLGATGSVGAACAQILARDARYLTLAARSEANLEKVAEQILRTTGLAVRVTANVKAALRRADVIIAVTSAVDSIIEPEDLQPGAVVCDVSRPRNVSRRVTESRDDVLVIEGGVVEVPGDVDFGFHFGFPERMAYACMAETMILALEGRYENYSLGRSLTVRQVEQIGALAQKHGFKLAGLRSFEQALTEADIERIRANADRRRACLTQARISG